MSGVHWWPAETVSSVAAGAGQVVPSGELRTKTFDCPLASSAFQTTCTPLASAATAGAVVNREKVRPLGQANGPSPQSVAPLPLNWVESNSVIVATCDAGPKDALPSATGVTRTGRENVSPWSVDRENSTALFGAKPSYWDQATYTLPDDGPVVWSTVRLILSWNSPVRNCPDGVPRLTR